MLAVAVAAEMIAVTVAMAVTAVAVTAEMEQVIAAGPALVLTQLLTLVEVVVALEGGYHQGQAEPADLV